MTAQLAITTLVVSAFIVFVVNNLGIAGRRWPTAACWIFMLASYALGFTSAITGDLYPLAWLWTVNLASAIAASAELGTRRREARRTP